MVRRSDRTISGWPTGTTASATRSAAGQNEGVTEALVGREWVQGGLRAALDAMLGGSTRFVVITGEPGAGKTALAQWLVDQARARGVTVAWGQCWAGDGAPSFWPWSQVVADLSLGDLLSGADEALDAAGARFRLFAAVAEALTARSRRDPLLVVLDDLQWADAASLRLLDFLTRHLREARTLLLATLRDNEPRAVDLPATGEYVGLAGLTVDEVATVLSGLGAPGAAEMAAAVHHRTGGNPFTFTRSPACRPPPRPCRPWSARRSPPAWPLCLTAASRCSKRPR